MIVTSDLNREMEKEGWQIWEAGDGLEVQRIDLPENDQGHLESDAEALELAKLFLARKVVEMFGQAQYGSRAKAVLLQLATAILNTEEGM